MSGWLENGKGRLQTLSNLKGIKFQFVVPTLFISFIVMLSLGVVLGAITITGVYESVDSKGKTVSVFLSKVSISYITNYDLTALESFVTELSKNSDVAYAVFVDKDKNVLAESKKGGMDLAPFLVYSSDIENAKGEHIGTFKIAYKKSDLYMRIFWSVFAVFIGIVLSLLAVGLRVYKVANKITDVLNEVSVQLLQSVTELTNSGSEITALSQKLQSSSHETEESIQSTVANMDQINAVTVETTRTVEIGMEKAKETLNKAAEGQNVVAKFEQAMTDISDSNKKLENIRDVVQKIEAKTQMIDEIVFQTKLLSFNANIEAARAGEHGKGFGVVADEVGKLARVSGEAAEEIGKLLNESTSRVENTIAETGTKAEAGQRISEICAEVFRKISTNIQELDYKMTTIADAAKEQAKGFRLTTEAMNSLSEASNRNTQIAQQANEMAGFLANQAESLRSNISRLEHIIGATVEQKTAVSNQHSAHPKNKTAA